MWAALRLRLLEGRRRGGPYLLGAAVLVVAWAALFAGETPDGRYGLASDLAATLTYLAAVFFGAFPLAVDRERRRSYLPSASPVAPWSWALGNALGAAALVALTGVVLFSAAGAGGGIDTHAVGRWAGHREQSLPVQLTELPEDATRLRIVPRVYVKAEEAVGMIDAATIEVDGESYPAFPNRPLVVSIAHRRVWVRNLSEDHVVAVVPAELRALRGRRSFVRNAVSVGVAPALGAAAVAAFGAMAGACLSAPVAALLTALVLFLGALKGFLVETIEHEGAQARAVAHAGHVHFEEDESALRETARTVVRATLSALPDLSDLDRTDRVAIGEWTGLARAGRGLLILCGALVLACALGGLGVRARRLP